MSISESTVRARDVNPRRRDSYSTPLIVAAASALLSPLSLISFCGGWLAYTRGRQQPSVIALATVIITLPFVLTGLTMSALESVVDNVLALFSNLSVGEYLHFVLAQFPFAVPIGLVASTGYALRKKMAMPKDDIEEFFRPTPWAILKKKRNVSDLRSHGSVSVGGIEIGVDEDTGDKVLIEYSDLAMHSFVVGASGSGKSTTLLALADKIIKDGHGMAFADLKGDGKLAASIARICHRNGVVFHHFYAEDPSLPYTGPSRLGRAYWNPMTRGDYDHLSDLLISMQEKGSGDSDVYRKAAQEYLKTLFHVVLLTGGQDDDTLSQITELLNPEALRRQSANLPNTDEGNRLRADVSSLVARAAKRERVLMSALDTTKTTVANLRKSIEGNYLQRPTDPNADYVDLEDIARKGEVVLFSLDSSSKGLTAQFIANYLIEDLKLLSSQLNANPSSHPMNVILDEFSAVTGDNLVGLINKARSAGISVILSTQTTDDLRETSDTFVKRVLSNTDVLICMRVNRAEEAEMFAPSFGTEMKRMKTTSYRSERHVFTTSEATMSGDESIREEQGFKVDPDDLTGLSGGEAWVRVSHRNKNFHVMIVPPSTVFEEGDEPVGSAPETGGASLPTSDEVVTPMRTWSPDDVDGSEIDAALADYKKEKRARTAPVADVPDGWVPTRTKEKSTRAPSPSSSHRLPTARPQRPQFEEHRALAPRPTMAARTLPETTVDEDDPFEDFDLPVPDEEVEIVGDGDDDAVIVSVADDDIDEVPWDAQNMDPRW